MKSILFVILIIYSSVLFGQTPDWQWVTNAGGIDDDSGHDIVTDDNGNCYVTGWFESIATFGPFSLTSNGDYDIFVGKIDENGNWLWVVNAGGSNEDLSYSIAVSNEGNIFITGYFRFSATFGTHTITGDFSSNVFVACLDTDGNWLWATSANGTYYGSGNDIGIDNFENCYVTGYFCEEIYFGNITLTSNGEEDIFVAKLDSDGNWQWAINAGGNDFDRGNAIALDNNANSYVTGYFKETSIFGSNTLSSNGNSNAFIAKMDENGNWLWASQTFGSNNCLNYDIVCDDFNNSYVIGSFWSTVTIGFDSLYSNGDEDLYVAKIDANGDWLWANHAGGNYYDRSYGISIDNNGNSYITGFIYDIADFGNYAVTSNGDTDIFIAKANVDGNWLWAINAGNGNYDRSYGIDIDSYGNILTTGYYRYSATFGSYTLNSCGGDHDIFVAKLGSDTYADYSLPSSQTNLSNYPNPFNPTTTIEFSIQNDSNIDITIFNIKGQKIKTLVQNEFTKGSHSIIWNGEDNNNNLVSSGIYYYKLIADGKTEAVKKCLLLK